MQSTSAVKTMPKLVSGFTLIELLVVIAIIGILASVVLASLNTARAKGLDAKIKAELSGIRVQSQIYYDTNKSYGDALALGACNTAIAGTIFFDDTKVSDMITAAGNASNGGGLASGVCITTAIPDAFAISVPLNTDNTLSWCVDSTGASKQIMGAITSEVCP